MSGNGNSTTNAPATIQLGCFAELIWKCMSRGHRLVVWTDPLKGKSKKKKKKGTRAEWGEGFLFALWCERGHFNKQEGQPNTGTFRVLNLPPAGDSPPPGVGKKPAQKCCMMTHAYLMRQKKGWQSSILSAHRCWTTKRRVPLKGCSQEMTEHGSYVFHNVANSVSFSQAQSG